MKLKNIAIIAVFAAITLSCDQTPPKEVKNNTEEIVEKKTPKDVKVPKLTLEEAIRLSELPLHCIETEYPNKPSQVVNSAADIQSPKELHPAFYGCFDWHSAVHGHWSLVSLLKTFPDIENQEEIREKLKQRISPENIAAEIAYFNKPYNKSYERTYGWAWLLKLAEELQTWNDPLGKELSENLKPLEEIIATRYEEFLPKLNYPVRVGTHSNTAFGLSLAYDYAKTTKNESLKNVIEKRARDFYMNDQDCPIGWEPSGTDFLSPCLEEADLMAKILPKEEFLTWVNAFLPELSNPNFDLKPGIVTDRTDGHLVHLDGLNFSRAWCFYQIAKTSPKFAHLNTLANEHINYSLPNLTGDSYEGSHWLGTFAIYALQQQN
ncbi:DUF2891 domain-containing protein [Aureivirga sp. CE67]|uniref:DUF2891 domain-containing protein n=1 Tax=Aureivirga sp. CE67 TaxID=1788983 RepID=UPI0018C92344|nr:DUF2891 domain-containing protein [Aureivirga sp. CE67]